MAVVFAGLFALPAGSGPATWTPNHQHWTTITLTGHDNDDPQSGTPVPPADQLSCIYQREVVRVGLSSCAGEHRLDLAR